MLVADPRRLAHFFHRQFSNGIGLFRTHVEDIDHVIGMRQELFPLVLEWLEVGPDLLQQLLLRVAVAVAVAVAVGGGRSRGSGRWAVAVASPWRWVWM